MDFIVLCEAPSVVDLRRSSSATCFRMRGDLFSHRIFHRECDGVHSGYDARD